MSQPVIVPVTLGASLADALAAIGARLGFEDHYGVNLDALADCLTDLDEPVVLQLDGWQQLAWCDPEGWSRLRAVLDERATDRLAGAHGVIELPSFRVVPGRDEGPPLAR